MKKSTIWKIIAIVAAVAALTTVIIIYRKQIREFISSLTAKVKDAVEKPRFTAEEYDDFADI